MRPPICAICRRRFDPDEGALVSFAQDAGDADWYERAKQPGFVGHPPHLEWFCETHVGPARALVDGTRREALRALRDRLDPPAPAPRADPPEGRG